MRRRDEPCQRDGGSLRAIVGTRGRPRLGSPRPVHGRAPPLWRHRGCRAETHDLLAPVYDWFTEGFDTADLEDAKALLDELA
jgi:hypothetical protein